MSEINPAASPEDIQRARGEWLKKALIDNERWSLRKLETATGLGKGKLALRFNGQSAISVSDVEVFAPLLRMTPEELFKNLRELPAMDSNHEPAGNESAAETRAHITDIRSKARRTKTVPAPGRVRPVARLHA